MLKTKIEALLGHEITQSEFVQAMEMATADIKFNRIGFNKKTYPIDMLLVVAKCHQVSSSVKIFS